MSNNDNGTVATEHSNVFSISAFGYTLSLKKVKETFDSIAEMRDHYTDDVSDEEAEAIAESYAREIEDQNDPVHFDQHKDIKDDVEPDEEVVHHDVNGYLDDVANPHRQYDVNLLPRFMVAVDATDPKDAVIQAIKSLDAENMGELESPVPVYNHLTDEETEVDIPASTLNMLHEVGAVANEPDETPDGRDVNQYLGQTLGNGDVNEYLGEADD
jgi:hypothetical protein